MWRRRAGEEDSFLPREVDSRLAPDRCRPARNGPYRGEHDGPSDLGEPPLPRPQLRHPHHGTACRGEVETAMIVANERELTQEVLVVMERTRDPRLREIMISLVRHLHDFVRDVRLTEEEFRSATGLIARMGQLTTDTHNEVVLMAGSLGLSSLVCLLNNGDGGATETSASLLGPFWRMHSPRTENGGSLVPPTAPGAPLFFVVPRPAPTG